MNAAGSLSPSPRTLEVESLDSFDRLVTAGAGAMHGWHAQSLDLRGRTAPLRPWTRRARSSSAAPSTTAWRTLRSRGALIFPRMEAVPFNPYRGQLYTPQELYAGPPDAPYEATLDARVYQWSIRPGQRHRLDATLAAALHDHAIGDALDELVRSELGGRTMVGVMGGTPRGAARRTSRRPPCGPAPRQERPGGGHRRRSRGHGGRQPGCLPQRAAGRGFHAALARWQPFRGSGPPCRRGRGRRPPSSKAIRTARRRWGSPPGSTATSRRTSSPPTSRSTSPTPSARRSCWSFATAA